MSLPRRFLAAAAITLGGCTSVLGEREDPGLAQFREAKAAWRAHGITSYSFVVTNQCTCALAGKEVRVVVQAGSITTLTQVETGQAVTGADATRYRSFDALFDVLEDGFNKEVPLLEVQYDFTYRFPSFAYINYSASQQGEEFGWTIGQFTTAN